MEMLIRTAFGVPFSARAKRNPPTPVETRRRKRARR
jgi:hypothetical protein